MLLLEGRCLVTKSAIKLLIVYQVLDALLTYWGIKTLGHGINIEGNPLIRQLMSHIGVIMTLVLVKSIVILYLSSFLRIDKHPIVSKLLIFIICAFYTFVVGTWLLLFVTHILGISSSIFAL